jgi:ribosomal protein L37AE/L43A
MYEDVPGQPLRLLHCPACGSRRPWMRPCNAPRMWHCDACDTTWRIERKSETPSPIAVEDLKPFVPPVLNIKGKEKK